MAASFNTPLPKHYSASRELRNQAEKQRRDKLNHHVSELASLVPFVVRAHKKIDKTSVLRLAASYLRLHKIFRSSNRWHAGNAPVALLNEENSRNLLTSIGGFLLVVTSAGKIVFASNAIEDTFGYSQADILGQSFYSLVHHDDRNLVQQQLNPQDFVRRSFYCRLLEKPLSRNDPRRYEIIHVVGQFKALRGFSATPDMEEQADTEEHGEAAGRRKKFTSESSVGEMSDDEESDSSEPNSPHCPKSSCPSRTGTHMLVAFVQVVRDKPITELTWVESMRDEYITRHRMDGNICHADHRLSFITGLMPEEVLGSCAFQYMHPDDILWSVVAQKQMFSSSQGQGMVTYRLVCRDGSYVSLRSRGFLEVDKTTGKVDTFVCINTVLRESDAEEEVKAQRKQLLPLISDLSADDLVRSIGDDLPPTLRAIVKYLINDKALQRMINTVDNVSISKDEKGSPLSFASIMAMVDPCSSVPDHRVSRERCSSKIKEVSDEEVSSILHTGLPETGKLAKRKSTAKSGQSAGQKPRGDHFPSSSHASTRQRVHHKRKRGRKVTNSRCSLSETEMSTATTDHECLSFSVVSPPGELHPHFSPPNSLDSSQSIARQHEPSIMTPAISDIKNSSAVECSVMDISTQNFDCSMKNQDNLPNDLSCYLQSFQSSLENEQLQQQNCSGYDGLSPYNFSQLQSVDDADMYSPNLTPETNNHSSYYTQDEALQNSLRASVQSDKESYSRPDSSLPYVDCLFSDQDNYLRAPNSEENSSSGVIPQFVKYYLSLSKTSL